MKNIRDIYSAEECTEIQERFWEEYEDYIETTPMTAYERRLLRKWVSEGHSVSQSPGSKYLPDRYPPADFLETYREDREITQAIKGMTKEETETYLKEYTDWTEPDPEQKAYLDIKGSCSAPTINYIRSLQRELCHLWEFIWNEGIGDEAREFVDEHKYEESAFEWWMPAAN